MTNDVTSLPPAWLQNSLIEKKRCRSNSAGVCAKIKDLFLFKIHQTLQICLQSLQVQMHTTTMFLTAGFNV